MLNKQDRTMKWKARALKFSQVTGLPLLEPVIRLIAGEDRRLQIQTLLRFIGAPVLAIGIALFLWSQAAKYIRTDSAQLPSPSNTLAAAKDLWASHLDQKEKDRQQAAAEYKKALSLMVQALQVEEKAKQLKGDEQQRALENATSLRKKADSVADFKATSAPTFVDQTIRSIGTVFVGFFLATLIAVPLGLLCGMSPLFSAAVNPLIQLFKPVSPLAWLPIASIVIIWWCSGQNPDKAWFSRAFLISATTVCLCSLWPTLVNTALGVASVNKDYLNVAKVLNLSWWQTLVKIILPASLPYTFAGLRISLGVGWMVLIAADMLAQNPGLGKFVWDMFQNGSNMTYSRIAVAVLVIGIVGLVLDRLMICLRNLVTYSDGAST
jgi:nitrate/nitrite transport system permease protein